MARVNLYLTDMDVELLDALKAEGVKPSRLLQDAIRQEAKKYGYEYVPAQIIKRPAKIVKHTADSMQFHKVG